MVDLSDKNSTRLSVWICSTHWSEPLELDHGFTPRHGEPRSLESRQFQELPPEVQVEIQKLVQSRKMSQAAVLWKKHVGGELRQCLEAVQRLGQ